MNNRGPNIVEWLALLAFVCLCFLGAARAFALENGEAEHAPYTLACDWSQAPGGCAGQGNPTLTVTRATVQQCPDSPALISASYTSKPINTACVTPNAGLLVEGQRYNYLGCASLTNAGCGESCAGGDVCLDNSTTGNTPSLAVASYTFWTRPATQTTLDLDICQASGGTVVINGMTLVAGSVCYGVRTVPATGTRITVSVSAAVLTFTVRGAPDFWQLENGKHISTPIENVGAMGTSTFRAATAAYIPGANVVNNNNYGGVLVVTTEWDSSLGCAGGNSFYDRHYGGNEDWIWEGGICQRALFKGGSLQTYTTALTTSYQIGLERMINWWTQGGRAHVRLSDLAPGATADQTWIPLAQSGVTTIFIGSYNSNSNFADAWIRQLKICSGACPSQLREWGNP